MILRTAAVAFWLACAVFIAVPSHAGVRSHPGVRSTPFQQPPQPKIQVLRLRA